MPEIVSRSSFSEALPAAPGPGTHFTPLPQDVKDGRTRAHAMQTIRGDRESLYKLWRDVTFAPRWQEYVVSVEPKTATRSTWTFGDPEDVNGKRVSFDTEVVVDEPGSRILWRSVDSTAFEEEGEVTFVDAPGGRGTLVTLRQEIKAPGGRLAIAAASAAKRSPKQIVIEDLRHFKELAETGEIPSVVDNSHGPRGFIGTLKQRLYGENNPTPPGTSVAYETARAATSEPNA